jgi:putative transposase
MGVPRSSYYAAPAAKPSDDAVVAEIRAITEACPAYGYRRVGAELRHRDKVVNAKKIRRLMKQNDLGPRRRPRFVRTTDSDHDGPIFPFIAKTYELHGPDQLWVADLTYIALATGFAYLAVVLDAWSRRVVGYALGRRIDARLAVAALARAIASRRPLPGCVFHSDRGAQGGLNRSSQHPDAGGCDDEEEALLRSGWAASAAVSGPPACLAARSSGPVLVSGRLGMFKRRRGRRGGCIAGGWDPLVPGGRRHATIASCSFGEAAVGAVPVLRRA